jgi:hypothetical protein
MQVRHLSELAVPLQEALRQLRPGFQQHLMVNLIPSMCHPNRPPCSASNKVQWHAEAPRARVRHFDACRRQIDTRRPRARECVDLTLQQTDRQVPVGASSPPALGRFLPLSSLRPIGSTSSYLTCRLGRFGPYFAAYTGPSFQQYNTWKDNDRYMRPDSVTVWTCQRVSAEHGGPHPSPPGAIAR